MASRFFNIPRTIKQQFLPFRLSPGTKPQMFSFKDQSYHEISPSAQLHIAPKSAYTKIANDDISNRLLFDKQAQGMSTASLSLNTIINKLPCVQIREYLIESKLNQLVSLMSSFMEGFSYMASDETSIGDMIQNVNIKDITDAAKMVIENFDSIIDTGYDAACSVLPSSLQGIANSSADAKSILGIVYLFYYRMVTSTVTNVYELPYNGDYILTSDGSHGWNARGLEGLSTNGESIFGKILNYFGSNLSFNMSPTWDGAKQQTPLTFDVNFSLYNDTYEAAKNNFIFVNTLIPGNNWMQYHVFQHAPNLFDVKIDGIQRYFMCTAKIDCTKQGILRSINQKMFDELIANAGTNPQYKGDIRIPDVYNIKITFTSLLPNNFNNYLFSYFVSSFGVETGDMESGATKFIDAAKEEVKSFIKTGLSTKGVQQLQAVRDAQVEADKAENGEYSIHNEAEGGMDPNLFKPSGWNDYSTQ